MFTVQKAVDWSSEDQQNSSNFALLLYTEECRVWKKEPRVEVEPSSSQEGDPKGTSIRTEAQSANFFATHTSWPSLGSHPNNQPYPR